MATSRQAPPETVVAATRALTSIMAPVRSLLDVLRCSRQDSPVTLSLRLRVHRLCLEVQEQLRRFERDLPSELVAQAIDLCNEAAQLERNPGPGR